jgi:pimeloyl-ACP methyl ester carboxylesterase
VDESAVNSPERIGFDASGLHFAALAWGPADGPLALCLHGYPDTAWTWRHLGPQLAQRGFRVVAPFQRGYAPTELAPDGAYQIGALARDAIGAHAALGGDERAVLIGHDWGAIAAYSAASYAPERFARVVTLAVPPAAALLTAPRSLGELWLVLRQLRCSWYVLFQQLPGLSEAMLERIIPQLWADWSPAYDAEVDLAHVWAALGDAPRRTAALRYYRALAQPWFRSPTYAPEQAHMLRLPPCPILFLYGEDDGCLLPALSERARAVIGPGSELEMIRGAGHFLQLERPDEVGARIAAFLVA